MYISRNKNDSTQIRVEKWRKKKQLFIDRLMKIQNEKIDKKCGRQMCTSQWCGKRPPVNFLVAKL